MTYNMDQKTSYYLRHKQNALNYQRQYIRANREKIREYQHRYFMTRYANSRKRQELKELRDKKAELRKLDPELKKKYNKYYREYMRSRINPTSKNKKASKVIKVLKMNKTVTKNKTVLKYPIKQCYIDDGEWFILNLDN